MSQSSRGARVLVAAADQQLLLRLVEDPHVASVRVENHVPNGLQDALKRDWPDALVTTLRDGPRVVQALRILVNRMPPVIYVAGPGDAEPPPPGNLRNNEYCVTLPGEQGGLGPLLRAVSESSEASVKRLLVMSACVDEATALLAASLASEPAVAALAVRIVSAANGWLKAVPFDCIAAAPRLIDGHSVDCLKERPSLRSRAAVVALSRGDDVESLCDMVRLGCGEVLIRAETIRPTAIHSRLTSAIAMGSGEPRIGLAMDVPPDEAPESFPIDARHCEEKLRAAHERATSGRSSYLFHLIEVDELQEIRDAEGPDVAETMVEFVSKVLREQLEKTDVFAQPYDGTFAIIREGSPEPEAIVLAERLREAVEQASPRNPRLRVSVGVAFVPRSVLSPSTESFSSAEFALYAAKVAGGNRVELWRPALRFGLEGA